MTKLKNSNCDHTQKLQLWQKYKKQIYRTQKLKFDKTQIVTKIKILNCDKTQLKLWQNSTQIVELTQGTTA